MLDWLACLAANDAWKGLDDDAKDPDAQRNPQRDQIDGEKAIHDGAGIGKYAWEI